MRFYPLIILSHIFHFFRAKNCTQNNIFPRCFSLQSHFTTSNPLGKLKYCTQKSIYDKRTSPTFETKVGLFYAKKTTPLQFCTGVVLIGIVCIAWESFRPLHFCTGVVPDEQLWRKVESFRPLQFCTGVVRGSALVFVFSGFRPLQFCTGVVLKNVNTWIPKGFRPLHFRTGVVLP